MTYESLDGLLAALEPLGEDKYRAFNESLIPGAEGTSMGVRTPQLRAIARDLCKSDWEAFLRDAADCPVYEIVLLRGLVIAGAPCDFSRRLRLLEAYIPAIGNWAVCDCVASSLKDIRRHLPESWDFLTPYLASREEFQLRFALVLLMNYFLTPEYIDRVLDIYAGVSHPGYYVKMAVAWALSVCFVKHRDKTLALLERRSLDPWTQNKAIQKCRESRRVSPSDKALLQSLRIYSDK